MLVFPMLAASLVLSTSSFETSSGRAERAGTSSPFTATNSAPYPALRPARVDPAEPRDSNSRGAKRKQRKPAKNSFRAAKRASLVRRPSTSDLETLSAPRPIVTRENATVCPSDMVTIGGSYCIDPYEASLVEVMPDGSEQPWPYYEVLASDVVVRAVTLHGVFPQGYVSGRQAAAACERSGKRLCTPTEWRKACMGPDRTVFPYGNYRETGRCNDNGRSAMHLLNPDLDSRPEHRWKWGFGGNMIDPRLNQMPGTLARTGERSGCTNEYGVFDMVGNLHEWVDDPNGTFQGGYYLDTHLNGDGCLYRTTAHPISHYDYSTGFRCCADIASM